MKAALFAVGSALLLLGKEDGDDGDGAEATRTMADRRPVRVALASFGVVPAVLAVLSLVEAIRA